MLSINNLLQSSIPIDTRLYEGEDMEGSWVIVFRKWPEMFPGGTMFCSPALPHTPQDYTFTAKNGKVYLDHPFKVIPFNDEDKRDALVALEKLLAM